MYYRHEHIRKCVRLVGNLKKLLVDCVEILHGFLFVAEHLDDLLTVHHFLDVSFHLTDGFLLCHKVFCTVSAYLLGYQKNTYKSDKHRKEKLNAQIHHDKRKHDKRYHGRHELGKTLRNYLAERVNIVCVYTHDIAVGVGVKISYRKPLHTGKHFYTHIAQESLRQRGAYKVEYRRADNTYKINYSEREKRKRDAAPCLVVAQLFGKIVFKCGIDLVEEKSRNRACNRADYYSGKDYAEHTLVVFEKDRKQPLDSPFFDRTESRTGTRHFSFDFVFVCSHYALPPSPATAPSTVPPRILYPLSFAACEFWE